MSTTRISVGAPGAMLVVISGPSGVGKDTILKVLKERQPVAPRHYVVTFKSRDPRPGEQDGVDYHFVGSDRFGALRSADAFLETAEVYGQWSGTPTDQVVEALGDGKDVLLKVDVQGARSVRRKAPDAVMVFVAPESREALRRQLIDRNTESPEQLKRRLEAVDEEMAAQPEFDYVVINHSGRPAETADEIERIIANEHRGRADRQIRL
jgi:guanylate kinase